MTWQIPDPESLRRQTHVLRLTKREIEVLWHKCLGKTDEVIAQWLTLGEKTIDTHVTNAYKKLEDLEDFDKREKLEKLKEIYCPIISSWIRSADDIGRWKDIRARQGEAVQNAIERHAERARASQPEIVEPPPEPRPLEPRPPVQQVVPDRDRGQRIFLLVIGISAIIFICVCILAIGGIVDLLSGPLQVEQLINTPVIPTSTIPPGLLFLDDFEDNIRGEWRLLGARSSHVENGKYWGPFQAFVGDKSWKNYIVEIKMNAKDDIEYGNYRNGLSVRAEGPLSKIELVFLEDSKLVWQIQSPHSMSDWYEMPEPKRRIGLPGTEDRIYIIRVEGNKIGTTIIPVANPDDYVVLPDIYIFESLMDEFSSGGIGLRIETGFQVDYVRVSPIP